MEGASRDLHVGDTVEILSEKEILASLDGNGTCEGLPFMPEMRKYCGRRFRVYRRADKICVEGAYLRRMRNAVTLERVTCDGTAHEKCARMCLIFWKEAWLRKVNAGGGNEPDGDADPGGHLCASPKPGVFSCQSTELVNATTHLSSLEIGQYLRDVSSGNFRVTDVITFVSIYLYNKVAYWTGRPEFGKLIGNADRTQRVTLHLQPGDLVEVRTREEILQTLDRQGRNRGLHTDWEALRHCGNRYRVLRRIDNIVLETTGQMRAIQDTVILEGTECSGLLRRGCARGCFPFWREAWLKRVEEQDRPSPVHS
ncbi:MAG TPA: hypothetical protein VL126_13350 [Bacteroidota bacterium]|nr:hypothetical protein [Bacteroidota bacterium]